MKMQRGEMMGFNECLGCDYHQERYGIRHSKFIDEAFSMDGSADKLKRIEKEIYNLENR